MSEIENGNPYGIKVELAPKSSDTVNYFHDAIDKTLYQFQVKINE
jgi:hypothetical protein